MMNARNTAIKEFNWPEDVSWEDFFDTCLVYLFRYWGWGLQEAYKLDEKETGGVPKPASEKAEDNGHKQQERLEQATKLGLVMMEILRKAQSQSEHQLAGVNSQRVHVWSPTPANYWRPPTGLKAAPLPSQLA
ncbi:hypothetical protein ACFLX9_02055 [Chloroflexota bacterium]